VIERDIMQYDVVIVGAGPAGLATAIQLRQLSQTQSLDLSVCVIEKGSEVGAHILSGAVFEPRALNELIPDWQQRNAPLNTAVKRDKFLLLTTRRAWRLPTPPQMDNQGNYIISLGNLCRWLAEQAEALGVDIFAGFAAAEILYHTDGSVKGIATGDMGIDKDGQRTAAYQPGVELHAPQTVFAEGCRGSLTKQLFERFHLRDETNPQTYGIGIKELWEVPAEQHQLGLVVHTIGYPLDTRTYGGSFIYHLDNQQVAMGFVVGLDYQNPYLDPYQEFQRFKLHPAIRPTLANGRRLAYGARSLSEGGWQALPKLTFPGGMLVGDSAGFLNVPKIKGTHTAMKSGMLAAEAIITNNQQAIPAREITTYTDRLKASWLYNELHQVRNIRPAFQWGLWAGLAYAGLDTYLLGGRAPWTFRHQADHTQLRLAKHSHPIDYPKPDNQVTFDRLTSVALANVAHEENQPCHLTLRDTNVPIQTNLAHYAAPEQRYCPAGVYEIIAVPDKLPYLQINAANCVHCKTCDIKDPTQNIHWVVPEGGSGPHYPNM